MPKLSKELKAALESDCAHSLEAAAASLSERDLDALVEIVDAAADPIRRQNAISLLGRSGYAAAVPAIARVLPEVGEDERCRAISALGKMGGAEAIKAVVNCAGDDSPQVRKFAGYALREIDEPAAAAALKKLERDESVDWVRKALKRKRKGKR